MPRQTTDQPVTTRNARSALAPRPEPYWRSVDSGAAIGYRKTRTGGFWIARVMVDGKYREGAVGRADDALKSDGSTILDYRQAVEKAKAWASTQHHVAAGTDPRLTRKGYTVADAMRDYVADYIRRGGKGVSQTRYAIEAHILPGLGAVRLDRLNRQRLTAWRNALADSPPRLRTTKAAPAPRHKKLDPEDAEGSRCRRASTNRVLTVLKAALNFAHHEGRVHVKDAWTTVKPFRESDAPSIRYLVDAEAARLVEACPQDLGLIVTAALLTGMRYGEISRLKISDFNSTNRTITVEQAKSGKRRHVVLTDEGCRFFSQVTVSKSASMPMFTRDNGGLWGKSHQQRPLQDACAIARIMPAVSFHILRHTYASRLAMAGVPMPLVAAQLGHESTRMTERHYAHLAPSYVADTIRSLFSPMGIVAHPKTQ